MLEVTFVAAPVSYARTVDYPTPKISADFGEILWKCSTWPNIEMLNFGGSQNFFGGFWIRISSFYPSGNRLGQNV